MNLVKQKNRFDQQQLKEKQQFESMRKELEQKELDHKNRMNNLLKKRNQLIQNQRAKTLCQMERHQFNAENIKRQTLKGF